MADPETRSTDASRRLGLVAIAVAVGVLVALYAVYLQRGFVPGDAFTYLGAGERLNAGHPLYAISPGDRFVGVEPPFWTVPLLSPPPIAVLWRALAALPNELGVYVWWLVDLLAIVTTVVLLFRRRPLLTAAALLVLAVPIVYEIGVANMNGLILLGLVLTWRATASGDERSAGVLTGVLAAFKITPAILGWWLLTARRWTAIRWAIGAGLAVLAVSVLGAGLANHFTYLDVLRETSVNGARPLSLGGIALFVGVPASIANLIPTAALVVGIVVIAALRRRPAAAFVVAVVTMVFGSPTVSINWLIDLLACLAPLAWPLAEAAEPTTAATPVPNAAAGSQPLGV